MTDRKKKEPILYLSVRTTQHEYFNKYTIQVYVKDTPLGFVAIAEGIPEPPIIPVIATRDTVITVSQKDDPDLPTKYVVLGELLLLPSKFVHPVHIITRRGIVETELVKTNPHYRIDYCLFFTMLYYTFI